VEIPPIRLVPIPREGAFDGPGTDRGVLNGVGFRLSRRTFPPTVLDVFPGSPAARAGLVPGTVIRSIDGRDVRGYGRSADALLLGPPGGEVTLVVETPGGEPRAVSLVRQDWTVR
jgi:carboxyl-terminal processing protease